MASSEQEQLWNGSSGQAWVESQELLDHVLAPFETLLVEAAAVRSPAACSTWGAAPAAPRSRSRAGSARAPDAPASTSPADARARHGAAAREGSPAEFIRADAQTHAFEPASVDMIVSRFGVMFFDDPVAAFANLRRASTGNAALRLIAWRSAARTRS
jgi:hypothetical protein